ncbi:glycosyltransferase family 4 protein [Aureisphaera galaxeae]|uniref:glycosyltransferase family 4 protein n=1 Tax=Aureisphaera galaxeae TaxID=1538023 RepID=UPI0023503F0B|nr:glycosyltransferase family 4 protein [Aureisphaera galaxeae]MDC8003434.1 glycosyltransferase family 4 protein [Aureisphaera galaxeae]
MPKTIYVLHKNGAPSHYYALEHLASKNGYTVAYREFSIFSKWYKGIVKGKWKLFSKQFTNAGFMLSLLLSKNKKVVVGIAPFDPKLKSLLPLLKKQQIYYHTSWTYWDGSFHPKRKKNTPQVMKAWGSFLENHCKHIFAVNQQGKSQLVANYNLEDSKVSVVHHSLHPDFTNKVVEERRKNSFVYVGRLTSDKGIQELLAFFSENPSASLTIIGDGKMASQVTVYSEKHPNIIFKGYVSGKEALKKEFASHQYMLLNSKKTSKWEELFGIIIIEAMSQGTLPIASNHSGPKEIIDESFGFLFEEGKLKHTLASLLESPTFTEEKSEKAIVASQSYTIENVSKHWQAIVR